MPALSLPEAVRVLQTGGLIAYPTEAVWGLGCDPFNPEAIARLLALKQRPASKGLILIAAELETILPLLDWAALPAARQTEILDTWPGPFTWVIPCRAEVPVGLRGAHHSLAVRISAHPVARALCHAFGGPVVSTSANRTHQPPARRQEQLDPALLDGLDGWLPGDTEARARPSQIRDARSGAVLRPG